MKEGLKELQMHWRIERGPILEVTRRAGEDPPFKRFWASTPVVNFTKMFMHSFYVHSPQMHKKTVKSSVFFALLGSAGAKAAHKILEKSISPLFYNQLFGTQMLGHSTSISPTILCPCLPEQSTRSYVLLLCCMLYAVCQWDQHKSGAKAAHRTFVKLTPDEHLRPSPPSSSSSSETNDKAKNILTPEI